MTNYPLSDQLVASDLLSELGNSESAFKSLVSLSPKGTKKISAKKRTEALLEKSNPPNQAERKVAIEKWRKKDNRFWSDEEVVEFPKTFFYNLHIEEWATKSEMATSFRNYLYHEAKSDFSVLEIGCGCGWFSHLLSHDTTGNILGLDQDSLQIEQAKRLFDKENLSFRKGDFFQARLRKNSFDYIILMDVHPWMGPIEQIIERAKSLLKPGGELHVLASNLPTNRTIKRTKEAFSQYCIDKMMDSVPQHIHWSTREDFLAKGFEELNSLSFVKKMLKKNKSGTWMRLLAGRQ